MTKERQDIAGELISADLRGELVAMLGDRLAAGEPLIAAVQFQKAMEEGYQAIRGSFPSESIKQRLAEVFAEVVKENPEVLIIPGIENWITRSVLGTVRKNGWGIAETQTEGQNLLRQFLRQEQMQGVLLQYDLQPADLNIRNCMRSIVNAVAGKEDPVKKRAAERLAEVKARLQAQGSQQPADAKLGQLLAGPAGEPDEAEVESRTQEQKKAQVGLRQQQMQHLVENLNAYIAEGRISAEEADGLRKLHQVDRAVRSGKVTREQGSKVRNTILSGEARTQIEKKMREEVDYVVVYAQVFEALQRIDPKNDTALRFMIRHKLAVNAEAKEEVVWKPIITGLIEELETLHQLIGIMDRQDAEVRMMAAHLPPYNQVVRRGQARMDKLLVEEEFIDLLREGTIKEVIEKLGGGDRKERARFAVSMLSINALIGSLIKRTPFRKQVRVLKINLIIEEFFRSTENVEEAREKAQDFLRTRLQKLYPDITDDEAAEIQEHSDEIIAACEQKVLAERAKQAKEAREVEGGEEVESEGGDEQLSEDEIEKGVQMGRVGMRIGGGMKLVPYKVMPDPEEPDKWVLVKRDRETDELMPVMRRGKKRFVEKNREGIWEILGGN
ncbi:MAG TPA: hypothetical protein EYG11_18015 [Candidatus Latescibacteria bacterium]|nr:hypothetical protein [Candidatus Latescibacterota bacterium]